MLLLCCTLCSAVISMFAQQERVISMFAQQERVTSMFAQQRDIYLHTDAQCASHTRQLPAVQFGFPSCHLGGFATPPPPPPPLLLLLLLPAAGVQGKVRLDAYLATQLPDASRAKISASIRAGLVSVNRAAATKPSQAVRGGDRIDVLLLPPEPCTVRCALHDVVLLCMAGSMRRSSCIMPHQQLLPHPSCCDMLSCLLKVKCV
jgi:hypothetical protein